MIHSSYHPYMPLDEGIVVFSDAGVPDVLRLVVLVQVPGQRAFLPVGVAKLLAVRFVMISEKIPDMQLSGIRPAVSAVLVLTTRHGEE